MSGSPITILPEQLERFARELGLTQAILTGWSPDGTMHVVTWGDSLTDSAQAAQGGNAIKRALGFPETLCRTLSPRVTEALARAESVDSFDAPEEEWVCLMCEERNVTRSDSDRCCVSCGMDLFERGELLRFLVQPAVSASCRRCIECLGEDHHWLTSIPECPEGGEPFIRCKHCDARAGICIECAEGPVWPPTTNNERCELCNAPEGV